MSSMSESPSPIKSIADIFRRREEHNNVLMAMPTSAPPTEPDEVRLLMGIVELRLKNTTPTVRTEAYDEVYRMSRSWIQI